MMKHRFFQIGVVFILLVISLVTCSSHKNSHRENVAYLYRHEALKLHPAYKVYHESDSITNVFYQINLTEFKYSQSKRGTYIAKYQIEYMLFENYKTKKILDSNSIVLYDSLNYNKNRSTLGIFDVKFTDEILSKSEDSLFVLKVLLIDLNADHTATYMVDIDKKDNLGRQNFYLKGEDGFPVMTDYLSKDQRFQIVSNDPSLTQLSGKRFRTVYPAAPPPHFGKKTVNTRRIADTTYKIEMTNGISPFLKLDKQAYYHFYIDSARQQGLTLYRFTSQYPYVGTKMQTLMPLRYICNTREFNDMLAAKDKEKAVRKFWEEIGNTPNRTDELMADYYSLVTQANFLFTSDREGWKTDRGMIYIVFGPPNSVYKDGVNETWVYGDIESNLAVKFEFLKIDSPFTNNDYWLNRSTTYGQSWHSAVELWRR